MVAPSRAGSKDRWCTVLELGDDFELRVWGSLDDKDLPPLRQSFDPSVLHGRSLGNALTLLGGQLGTYRVAGVGGSINHIRIPLALIGHYWLDDAAEARFNQVRAELSGLLEWTNRRSISTTSHKNKKVTLKYSPASSSVAEIDGATVKLILGITSETRVYSSHWDQTASLEFELADPDEVDGIDYRLVRPFRYFLDLATGVPPQPGRLQVANPVHVDTHYLSWLDARIYGRNRPDNSKSKKELASVDMLFTLQDIDFSEIVPRWYSVVEKLGITCDLLLSVSTPRMFIGNQMFNLASAAEGVHQRLYPKADRRTPAQKKRLDEGDFK
jgi:hypothetical protein